MKFRTIEFPMIDKAIEFQAMTDFLGNVIEQKMAEVGQTTGEGERGVSFAFPVEPESCRCQCLIEEDPPIIGKGLSNWLVTQDWVGPEDRVYARNGMKIDGKRGRISGGYSYDAVGDQESVSAPILSPVGLDYLRWTVDTIWKGLARQEQDTPSL